MIVQSANTEAGSMDKLRDPRRDYLNRGQLVALYLILFVPSSFILFHNITLCHTEFGLGTGCQATVSALLLSFQSSRWPRLPFFTPSPSRILPLNTPHYNDRRTQDLLRLSSRPYLCPSLDFVVLGSVDP